MTVTLPLTLIQLLVVVFIAVPSLCVIATLTTERAYNRYHRRNMRRREKDVKLQNELLAEQRDILEARNAVERDIIDAREVAVTDREETVSEREQALRREAKETSVRIVQTAEDFDTMINVLEEDFRPHPFENMDTIAIPAVKDD